MGIEKGFCKLNARVEALKEEILSAKPCIEVERALLITEGYKETENLPIVLRKATVLAKILKEIPIVIRDNELIVGTMTKNPRSAQVYPEFSNKWLVAEFDRIGKRTSDSYAISEETKKQLLEAFEYWEGKTCLLYTSPSPRDRG